MNAKSALSWGLLLLAGVATAVLVGREINRGEPTAEPVASPQQAVVAYYFHGKKRCPTCRKIESFSQEAIGSQFADALDTGAIEWRVVNYELPENTHFATDYEIVSPTVVLVRTEEGEVVDWENLTKVWKLVGDKDAFVSYIQEQTEEMLSASAG